MMARMSFSLESVLAESSRVLDLALADAQLELAALDQRRSDLIEMIGQAEAMKRSLHSSTPGVKPLTLHEAICLVLSEQGNQWMTVRELAHEVNSRRLYQKKDGSEIETNQIHARTKNYDQLFEKSGPNVRMRSEVAEHREMK